MKKKISFVPIDSTLELWLIEKLSKEPPKTECAEELLSGLQDIIKGEVSSLLLGTADNTQDIFATQSDKILIGELEIYTKTRKVVMQKKEVSLTPKEYDILYFLVQNRGEIFSKEQIYRAVWADDYLLDDSNIMAFIRKLRKKIEPDPDAPKYILTIWGVGYKFNDEI